MDRNNTSYPKYVYEFFHKLKMDDKQLKGDTLLHQYTNYSYYNTPNYGVCCDSK